MLLPAFRNGSFLRHRARSTFYKDTFSCNVTYLILVSGNMWLSEISFNNTGCNILILFLDSSVICNKVPRKLKF
jgi:hypothetical protein